jgi:uncharacterized protein with gpF-like domain
MNQQFKREYWQVFDNFRKSREQRYAPAIQKVLNLQKKEFVEQFKQGNTSGFKLNSQPLTKVIRSLYFDAGTTFGHKVLVSIKRQKEQKARMPIGFNERMQQLIEQYYGVDFLNISEGITDTTRDLLVKVLTDAQRQGLGFDDTIKLLEDTELSKSRSRLIARTETVTAANSGAHLSAKESGIVVNKVWIATQDDRTRHDHYNVSTEAISIDEPFIVGAYEMLHPGIRKQPNGLAVPPKEICNCRCVEAFEAVRDASGRVLTT